MGGFVQAIKDFTADPAVRNEAKIAFKKALRPMESIFNETEIGKSLFQDHMDYAQNHDTILQQMMSQENMLPFEQRRRPNDVNAHAAKLAQSVTYGKNHARISGHIQAAHLAHGPYYAGVLQDLTHMYLRDTVDIDALSEGQKYAKYKHDNPLTDADKAKGKVSLSKLNFLNSEFSEGIKEGHNTDYTYKPPGLAERTMHSYANTILAPFIAIPHIGTLGNYALSGGIPELSKALIDLVPGTNSYKKWHQTLETTGIFGHTAFRAYQDMYNYRNGIVAKMTSPTIGYYLNKVIHQPGFNALRDWQLCFGGTVADLSSKQYAMDYFQSGSKKAAHTLEKEMGLNLSEIKQNKGVLTEEQRERAIYNYVDKKIFINTAMRRSYYANANIFTRTALMFHNYVASQGQLMRQELVKAWTLKGSDPLKAAQFLAVAAAVFPVVGEGIKQLERIGRGQDPDLQEDIDDFKKMDIHTAYVMADAYAHMAGFGIAASYTQGATRSELANTLIGPIPNTGIRLAEDTIKPANTVAKKYLSDDPKDQKKKVNLKPLARDVLEDTMVDNTGKIITHRWIPTEKEKKERGEIPPKFGTKIRIKSSSMPSIKSSYNDDQ
jgi:hypothetical protein